MGIWGKVLSIVGQFGSQLSYTLFGEAGHQSMVGAARPWRDELGDALSLRVQGTGLSANAAEGVVEFSAASDLNDYLYKNLQLNHDRDMAEAIYPHLHFFQANAAMPNFLLQYRWQINGGTKVTPWVNLRCNLPALTYVSGTLNQIARTQAGITPPPGSALSDIVQFRIIRDNANASGLFGGADAYPGVVGVLSFDAHLNLNSLGSNDQYSK